MKKLLFCFFSTFFVIMFIWFVMGVIEYGDDIVNYHFDFKHTLQNFTDVLDISLNDIVSTMESFYKIFITPPASAGDIFTRLFNLLYLPFELLFKLGKLFVEIILSIFRFVFEPKFYRL